VNAQLAYFQQGFGLWGKVLQEVESSTIVNNLSKDVQVANSNVLIVSNFEEQPVHEDNEQNISVTAEAVAQGQESDESIEL